MIAVVHQAYFLPWLGYFNKLAYADNFIVLDDVGYRPRYFHNRTHIRNTQGCKNWLTLPVGNNYRKAANHVKVIDHKCLDKIFRTIDFSYARTRFFKEYWPDIREAIESKYPNLVLMNVAAIRTIARHLGMTKLRVTYSSEMYRGSDPTDRLITCCKRTGSDRLIMGEGGSFEYHDISRIHQEGISIVKQQFLGNHPVYEQQGGGFLERLSTIDALFNVGAQESRRLILASWKPPTNFLDNNRKIWPQKRFTNS